MKNSYLLIDLQKDLEDLKLKGLKKGIDFNLKMSCNFQKIVMDLEIIFKDSMIFFHTPQDSWTSQGFSPFTPVNFNFNEKESKIEIVSEFIPSWSVRINYPKTKGEEFDIIRINSIPEFISFMNIIKNFRLSGKIVTKEEKHSNCYILKSFENESFSLFLEGSLKFKSNIENTNLLTGIFHEIIKKNLTSCNMEGIFLDSDNTSNERKVIISF